MKNQHTRRDVLKYGALGLAGLLGLGSTATPGCTREAERPSVVIPDTQEYEAIERDAQTTIGRIKDKNKYHIKIIESRKSDNGGYLIYGEAYGKLTGKKEFSFILKRQNPKSASLELLAEDAEGGIVINATEGEYEGRNRTDVVVGREKPNHKGILFRNDNGKLSESYLPSNTEQIPVNASPDKIKEYLEFFKEFKKLYGN